MSKKVAILQSNYIPWKGYFDIIARVDEFIIYDEMQYTKNDWRNRNKIKTPYGTLWLTIPVHIYSLHQKICETRIVNSHWIKKHLNSITTYYSKACCFKEYKEPIFELYHKLQDTNYLSEINIKFILGICEILGIKTKVTTTKEYKLIEGRTERLVDLCIQAGASEYITGPAARDYLDTGIFEDAGIKLEWMDYCNYPQYEQLYPPFDHAVSVIDLILNKGTDSKKYMKYIK